MNWQSIKVYASKDNKSTAKTRYQGEPCGGYPPHGVGRTMTTEWNVKRAIKRDRVWELSQRWLVYWPKTNKGRNSGEQMPNVAEQNSADMPTDCQAKTKSQLGGWQIIWNKLKRTLHRSAGPVMFVLDLRRGDHRTWSRIWSNSQQ